MRIFCLSIFVICLCMSFGLPAEALGLPQVPAEAAALFDLDTGELLAGINTDKKIFPASTTKVLTALIALELGNLDDIVSISQRAEEQEGTALYVKAGEEYLLEDLLYALLVHSDNDVAVAIAEHIAGSVEDFALLMNARAEAMGAKNTNFVNPNGLPHQDHYTTAADMSKIFSGAFKHPLIKEITSTRVFYIDLPSGERRPLRNGNRLLGEYPGILGGKTGYTSAAGNCLIAAAQLEETELGVAVFKARGAAVWEAAQTLLDYGFEHWQRLTLVAAKQVVTAQSARYGDLALLAAADDLAITCLKSEAALPLTRKLEFSTPLQAPLKAGEVVGEATFYLGEKVVGATQLTVAQAVGRRWYSYWGVFLVMNMALIWYYVEAGSVLPAKIRQNVLKRR